MGHFKKGKCGKVGKLNFPNGNVYEGHLSYFDEFQMHGKGKLSYWNGDLFDGEFDNGQWKGYGIFYY